MQQEHVNQHHATSEESNKDNVEKVTVY